MKLITFYGGPCHNNSIFVTDGTAAINMAFFDSYDARKADQTRPHQIANYIESEPGSLRFVHAPQRKAPEPS